MTQRVVIVSGNTDVLSALEPFLDAGQYNVVFVEESSRAYSQIRRVAPDMIILCVSLDDVQGFNLLSMLKLDEETRHIPVLTCTTDGDDSDIKPARTSEVSDDDFWTRRPVYRMN